MIIPYFKGNTGIVVLLNQISRPRPLSDDITYCCTDMMVQLSDKEFMEINIIDPPQLLFKNSRSVRIIRFCPNCGEKVETKRVFDIEKKMGLNDYPY